MKIDKHIQQRILEKLNRFRIIKEKNALCSCYEWTGATRTGKTPRINIDNHVITINRAAWIAHKGEIKKHHYILNTCRDKTCTNPDHLMMSKDKFEKLIPKKPERLGRKRLSLDFPTDLVDEIKKMAIKYNMTITKYLIKRLVEAIEYERTIDRYNKPQS